MSKWLFPPQDWGKVTKQPLATRVHGVKGDEQARVVSQYFAGPISNFLQAQTQQRASSGLDVYKSRVQLPDLQLSYAYIHGQEYLDIRVGAHLIKQLDSLEDFWDYALVELVLPDGYFDDGALQFTCHAHMALPVEVTLTADSVWPVDGVASNALIRSAVDPILNAANSAASIVMSTVTDEKAAASFTVDLRQARGGAAVLELYPYLAVQDERIPAPEYLTPAGVEEGVTEIPVGSGGPIGAADYNQIMTDDPAGLELTGSLVANHGLVAEIVTTKTSGAYEGWPLYAGTRLSFTYPTTVGGATAGDVLEFSQLPPTHFDTTAKTYLFDINDTQFFNEDLGHQVVRIDLGGAEVIDNSNEWWRHWYVRNVVAYVPPYTGPKPVPAKLNITLYKGVPNFTALGFTTAHPYDRWGDAAGNLVSPMISIDITVPVYSNDVGLPHPSSLLKDFYGVPRLGNVVLDTHRLIRGRPEIIENVTFNHA